MLKGFLFFKFYNYYLDGVIGFASIPFARILIVFLAGLLLQIIYSINLPAYPLIAAVLLCILFHFLFRNKTIRLYRYSYLVGLCFFIVFFLLGSFVGQMRTDYRRSNHYQKHLTEFDIAMIRILEPLTENEKTLEARVKIEALITGDSIQLTTGKAIIYLRKGGLPELEYGEMLMVSNNFKPPALPKNPDEFNYTKYLASHNIHAIAFLDSSQIKLLGRNKVNPLWQFTYRLRELSLAAFSKYISTQREKAVAEALVIGYRDHMNFDTMQSYSAAGVIHVLAVSGLHVGILYALLSSSFFFLDKKRKSKIIKQVLILALIWIFALLTGMTGSVLRATVMFTFFTFGKILNRQVTMTNILACSVLTILAFEPMIIMDVGFQLSYFAVFGITSLYPYLNNLAVRQNRIIDYLWKINCVAISAQAVTLPLAFHYFNQFPTYFLVANLVAIPVTGILLYLGIALIVFQFIPPLAWLLGLLMEKVTWLLNEFIIQIQHAPFAILKISQFSLLETVMLLLILIFITRFFITRNKKLFLAALTVFLMMEGIYSLRKINESDLKLISVYSFKGKSRIALSYENNMLLLTDSIPLTAGENFYFDRHLELRNIKSMRAINRSSIEAYNGTLSPGIVKYNDTYLLGRYRIAVIDTTLPFNTNGQKLPVHAILISGNPFLKLENLLSWYDSKLLIIDGNNQWSSVKYWKKEAAKDSMQVYNIRDMAFGMHFH